MTPTPPTDGAAELKERIIQAAAFNTKHISPYEPGMRNLIIDVDKLVEQMTEVVAAHLRTIESKLPEKRTPNLSIRDWDTELQQVKGFNTALSDVSALLTAEIEAITKEYN